MMMRWMLTGMMVAMLGMPMMAQFTSNPKTNSCVVECKGIKGDKGDKGDRGPKGDKGDPLHPPITVVPPFDLGYHGINLDVAQFFSHNGIAYVVVYEPTNKLAALVNLHTCSAQVIEGFNAGIPGPPLAWKQVQLTGEPFHFVWNHGGSWWSQRWPTGLPNVDLTQFVINDPRLGPGTALCRKRP